MSGVASIIYSSVPAYSPSSSAIGGAMTSISYGSVALSSVPTATSSASTSVSSAGFTHYVPARPGYSIQDSFVRSVNAGMYIGAVLLGVHTITLGYALVGAWRQKLAKDRAIFITVAGVLWVMALVYEICGIEFTIDAWIMGEGDNGTSFDYFIDNQGTGLTIAAAVAAFISTVFADGFLCTRCSALWSKLWVTIPLVLFTLATYAFDFVQMYWVASTNDESLWVIPWNGIFIIPVALAQSLHIIYTILLVFRLATVQHESGERISVKGMAIESALAYGVISVIFMGTYCTQEMAANAFLPMLVQVQGIAIDLIIARWRSTKHATVVESAAPTQVLLPAPAHVPSETSSISDNEKLMLAMLASKWYHELDKKESASPEYCV